MDQRIEVIRVALQDGLADAQRHCGIAAGKCGIGHVQRIRPLRLHWRDARLRRTCRQRRNERCEGDTGDAKTKLLHDFHFI